jgi:hypothetical protein
MTRAGAEGAVVTSSIVVGMLYAYRKLVEPTAGTLPAGTESEAVKRIIGLEPKPAPVAEFAVAYGFTFMSLSILALAAPDFAGAMAILVAVGDVLANGASVFTDINRQVAATNAPAKPKPAKAAS